MHLSGLRRRLTFRGTSYELRSSDAPTSRFALQGHYDGSARPGTMASEIMIIFRLFKIDRMGLGMRLFVDPETCRRNRQLNFEAEKWIIRST